MHEGTPVLAGVQRAQHSGHVGAHRSGDPGLHHGRVVVGSLHGGVLALPEQRMAGDLVRDERHGR
jgi:hypothetical protein